MLFLILLCLPPVLYYFMSPSLRYVSFLSFYIINSYAFLSSSFFFSFFLLVSQGEPEPISIYHPTVEKISASMGTPMEGFFDGTDVVFEAAAPTTPAAVQRVSAEALIPSTEPVSIDEGTHTERVNETAPIPAEILTPQEGAIPLIVA